MSLIGKVVFEMLKYYGNIHVYRRGVGADEQLGFNVFRLINIKSSFWIFSCISIISLWQIMMPLGRGLYGSQAQDWQDL